MKRGMILAIAASIAAATAAATAAGAQQFESDAESFLTAIREQDGARATALESKGGTGVVNYRGYSGETPLTVAMAKRSSAYLGFLLGRGANPDLADKRGDTPLIIAARTGFTDGIEVMLSAGAAVDLANRQGETPLILAVQGRHALAVRRLLEAGANPDKSDFAAGFSARDYARRDTRNRELLRLVETVKPRAAAVGPSR